MDKVIQLLILIGIVYGVIWLSQNINIDQFVNDTKQKMEQEREINRTNVSSLQSYSSVVTVKI